MSPFGNFDMNSGQMPDLSSFLSASGFPSFNTGAEGESGAAPEGEQQCKTM